MIYERIQTLCTLSNITATALCKKITGSSGNLSTWKKDNFNSATISSLANYFNVSTDYLLGLTDDPTPSKKPADSPASFDSLSDKIDKSDIVDKLKGLDDATVLRIVTEILDSRKKDG